MKVDHFWLLKYLGSPQNSGPFFIVSENSGKGVVLGICSADGLNSIKRPAEIKAKPGNRLLITLTHLFEPSKPTDDTDSFIAF
jgi:hypothetical protein